jgi:hypothetical protein
MVHTTIMIITKFRTVSNCPGSTERIGTYSDGVITRLHTTAVYSSLKAISSPPSGGHRSMDSPVLMMLYQPQRLFANK